ncbi:hypothetical protein [Deinococcus soli (ex Cha et al. 2016)]|uniref:Uncharacterized protein n=2 Tax=Deinococcus soli (ex Cha et al. 2016) TaxID=1309411 RepID=A0AAE3XCY5_9DEIO|nr:hypothetical protein [Deinococcus soli (ex Cha et al. 2016)]MDR6218654.1 hypothetical protein [Deinococcus soli (ex Cha et al. 2016)]MDR6328451.1 hypothetical protein [Deinococcus soli (ex Cha et al. 2016)]MDR6753062.1 hypothetical protein [Deinococcus soli (ex Cha et al. 2016)]
MTYHSYTEGAGPWQVWSASHTPRLPRVVQDAQGRGIWHGKDRVTWDDRPECDGSVDTDRLLMWDAEKHDALCRAHFGDAGHYWHDREPRAVEAFLRAYLEQPVTLVAIWQCNNVSSGQPVWTLFYTTEVAA